jgi:hypothetical protein
LPVIGRGIDAVDRLADVDYDDACAPTNGDAAVPYSFIAEILNERADCLSHSARVMDLRCR